MNNNFKIGERIIADDKPAYIIAEVGINHNGDFNIAKKMIDEAKNCGADCVKFQKRYLEYIYSAEILKRFRCHQK